MFKKVRVALLLYVLAMTAAGAWLARARTTDWTDTLWLTIYPINGDGSDVAGDYVDGLRRVHFEPIESFFELEADYHGLGLTRPIRIELGEQVDEPPPERPQSHNPLAAAVWSLRLRLWSLMVEKFSAAPADVEIFVLFHDPQQSPRLAHSSGLQKGLIGVVNAFASPDYAGSNNVVIAHEFLHTVGASDKYDPATGAPIYPEGFADPQAEPLYPQTAAEVMAGAIPVSKTGHRMPGSLESVIIGEATAEELGWVGAD